MSAFIEAAAEGLRLRREREERDRIHTLSEFWKAVARAERWVRDELPNLITSAVSQGRDRIILADSPGAGTPAGQPMSAYWTAQARTAGIRVDRSVAPSGPRDCYVSEIQVSQFLV